MEVRFKLINVMRAAEVLARSDNSVSISCWILTSTATPGWHLSSTNYVPDPALSNPHRSLRETPGGSDFVIPNFTQGNCGLERRGCTAGRQWSQDSSQVLVSTSRLLDHHCRPQPRTMACDPWQVTHGDTVTSRNSGFVAQGLRA